MMDYNCPIHNIPLEYKRTEEDGRLKVYYCPECNKEYNERTIDLVCDSPIKDIRMERTIEMDIVIPPPGQNLPDQGSTDQDPDDHDMDDQEGKGENPKKS